MRIESTIHNSRQEREENTLPQYNTARKKINLPGYGRSIQQMIDYCKQIEDRSERTRCACSIINSMDAIRPAGENKHILWDHLYYLAGYDIDIDFPDGYTPERLEDIISSPEAIDYPEKNISWRHYGSYIHTLIEKAVEEQDEKARNTFAVEIANQMKRCYVIFNKETVADVKIFDDLKELSGNKLSVPPGTTLIDAKTALEQHAEMNKPEPKKKKKKK